MKIDAEVFPHLDLYEQGKRVSEPKELECVSEQEESSESESEHK